MFTLFPNYKPQKCRVEITVAKETKQNKNNKKTVRFVTIEVQESNERQKQRTHKQTKNGTQWSLLYWNFIVTDEGSNI